MAFITWDSLNKSSGMTLSGGNLTATSTGAVVYGTASQSSGKWYFEITIGAVTSGINLLGLTKTAPSSTSATVPVVFTAPVSFGVTMSTGSTTAQSGTTAVGSGFGGRTAGDVICFAVDLDNAVFWVRIGAAGNWNNSAAKTPTDPSTGGSIVSVMGSFPGQSVYPFWSAATGQAITANFGASAFTGTVPTGFTSGWTDGGNNNFLASEISTEVWRSGLSDLRVTQASTEVWTPTIKDQTDPTYSNVVLRVTGDGSAGSTTFSDVSPSGHTITNVGSPVVTATSKFGGGAIDASGGVAGTALKISSGLTDFEFGTAAFTVECWIYVPTTTLGSGSYHVISSIGTINSSAWGIYFNAGFLFLQMANSSVIILSSFKPSINTWHHLAVDRDSSGVTRLYMDGMVAGIYTTPVVPISNPFTNSLYIGNNDLATGKFPGYIDDVRITKGVAVYGGPFTLPIGPQPTYSTTTTIWNPNDKDAGWTLSNGNLTATASSPGSPDRMVRANVGLSTGKYYFELLSPSMAGADTGFGLCTGSAIGSTLGSGPVLGAVVYTSGNLYISSVYQGFTTGLATNHTVAFAVDLTNRLMWVRTFVGGAWSVWNAGGSADPATGVGGVSFSGLTGLIFPCAVVTGATGVNDVTANFGASSFLASAPTGFGPGWGVAYVPGTGTSNTRKRRVTVISG